MRLSIIWAVLLISILSSIVIGEPCNQVLTASHTMTSDITGCDPSNSWGIMINASGVVLDCDNFKIQSNAGSLPPQTNIYGGIIIAQGWDNIQIIDCTVQDFPYGILRTDVPESYHDAAVDNHVANLQLTNFVSLNNTFAINVEPNVANDEAQNWSISGMTSYNADWGMIFEAGCDLCTFQYIDMYCGQVAHGCSGIFDGNPSNTLFSHMYTKPDGAYPYEWGIGMENSAGSNVVRDSVFYLSSEMWWLFAPVGIYISGTGSTQQLINVTISSDSVPALYPVWTDGAETINVTDSNYVEGQDFLTSALLYRYATLPVSSNVDGITLTATDATSEQTTAFYAGYNGTIVLLIYNQTDSGLTDRTPFSVQADDGLEQFTQNGIDTTNGLFSPISFNGFSGQAPAPQQQERPIEDLIVEGFTGMAVAVDTISVPTGRILIVFGIVLAVIGLLMAIVKLISSIKEPKWRR